MTHFFAVLPFFKKHEKHLSAARQLRDLPYVSHTVHSQRFKKLDCMITYMIKMCWVRILPLVLSS